MFSILKFSEHIFYRKPFNSYLWNTLCIESPNIYIYIYKGCSTKKLNATKRDWFLMLSVRRQKGQPQNRSYKRVNTRNCAYQGVRNIRFRENLMCFVFVTPVLRFTFLPYYWRVIHVSHDLLVKKKRKAKINKIK